MINTDANRYKSTIALCCISSLISIALISVIGYRIEVDIESCTRHVNIVAAMIAGVNVACLMSMAAWQIFMVKSMMFDAGRIALGRCIVWNCTVGFGCLALIVKYGQECQGKIEYFEIYILWVPPVCYCIFSFMMFVFWIATILDHRSKIERAADQIQIGLNISNDGLSSTQVLMDLLQTTDKSKISTRKVKEIITLISRENNYKRNILIWYLISNFFTVEISRIQAYRLTHPPKKPATESFTFPMSSKSPSPYSEIITCYICSQIITSINRVIITPRCGITSHITCFINHVSVSDRCPRSICDSSILSHMYIHIDKMADMHDIDDVVKLIDRC